MELDIRSLLNKDTKIAVLTGAGVSAESGIPTFRGGAGGLWAEFRPEELASVKGFRDNPKRVYDWYQWRRELVLKAEPNPAHEALSEWENLFPNFQLITQNVDGLHIRAGSKKIIEMHGSIHRMKCFRSSCEYRTDWQSQDEVPRCPKCQDYLRPNIVWFGEYLDPEHLGAIDKVLSRAEVFFAIGTSGTVYPAAGFLEAARRRGAKTVVINPDRDASGAADFFIQASAATALKTLTDQLTRA